MARPGLEPGEPRFSGHGERLRLSAQEDLQTGKIGGDRVKTVRYPQFAVVYAAFAPRKLASWPKRATTRRESAAPAPANVGWFTGGRQDLHRQRVLLQRATVPGGRPGDARARRPPQADATGRRVRRVDGSTGRRVDGDQLGVSQSPLFSTVIVRAPDAVAPGVVVRQDSRWVARPRRPAVTFTPWLLPPEVTLLPAFTASWAKRGRQGSRRGSGRRNHRRRRCCLPATL